MYFCMRVCVSVCVYSVEAVQAQVSRADVSVRRAWPRASAVANCPASLCRLCILNSIAFAP